MHPTLVRNIAFLFGAVVGVALIVAGLWAWQSGETVVALIGARQPESIIRAVRCAAVGAVALAQAVLVWMVVGAVYRRDLLTRLLALSGLLVFLLSLGAAAALGLSGR